MITKLCDTTRTQATWWTNVHITDKEQLRNDIH